MARRIAAFDWSRTPLGPIDRWSQCLRLAVDLCLNSRFPMFIWWGPELINIYNDGYVQILGKRHPDALGAAAPAIWGEIWPAIGPQAEAVMTRGESTWHEQVLLMVERNGFAEEAYFTWSHSPIRDEHGVIVGLFCVVVEDTLRIQAERDRLKADERARTILESITDAFIALDREWRLTYMNAHAERLLGRMPADTLGQVVWDLYPGLQGSEFEQVYRAVGRDRVPQAITSYYPDHDRWYEVNAYPAGDGGISLYFRDVSDRERAEAALRTSEERLALAVDASELGTFYCPMPIGEIIWNAKCNEHFWLPPEAKVDFERFYSIVHPDDRERTRAAVDRAVNGRQSYDVEYRTVAPDGRVRWVRAKGRAYYDQSGAPIRFDGVTLDITEQKQAEQSLRASEARFRTMADSAPVLVWIAGPDKLCNWFNKPWLDFTGRTMEQEYGFGWSTGVHAEDLDRCVRIYTESFDRRLAFQMDYRLRRHDGEHRWVLDHGVPLYGADGQFTGYIGSCIDITDRKRGEEERQALLDAERSARAEADHASRMKDEFLATLSHELRTPLNAIVGWAGILAGGARDEADLRNGLATIQRNARAQTQIIEDLLDMSGITSGKMRMNVQRINLLAVLRAAIETVAPAATAKEIRVDLEHADLAPVWIDGDPARLQQVFWNLLSNAVKFSNQGGRIELSLALRDSRVDVHVRDDGDGILPQFLPFVFDRFRQADASTTRQHGGLGLGLAIVKQLVELHGGDVQVESDGAGRGATFRVSLPKRSGAVANDADAAAVAAPVAAQGVAPSVSAKPPTDALTGATAVWPRLDGVSVVVVDDEPDARALVRRLLEDCDATVRTAGSVQEALNLIADGRPNVLISDIGMPGEDGYALLRRLRAMPSDRGGDLPAIALTAFAREADRVRVEQAGYQAHIVKPIVAINLVTTVARLAGR
ncbi:MAG TPA: PAS domain S-box protein [Tepidisphaeraceae bacterium]|nr:PAS domain S-box protein [Tepidisphaeraceae bacterium]